jgi:hypothetical protein
MAVYKLGDLLAATGGVAEGTLIDAGLSRGVRIRIDRWGIDSSDS